MKTLAAIALAVALTSAACASAARTTPAGACSAANLSAKLPKQNLPAAVASVRARIAAAAVACDYAKLQKIALEKGNGFKFSFGTEKSAAAYWRKLESQHRDKPLARLVKHPQHPPRGTRRARTPGRPRTRTSRPPPTGTRSCRRACTRAPR